ncbi:MAG: 50S ribosomal protein L3, partial [Prochlorothrix sp.]
MSVGILGTKLGMTQIFDEDGKAVPITVVQAGPCTITQVKTKATDGYEAIPVGYQETREKLLTRPALRHLQKSGAPP